MCLIFLMLIISLCRLWNRFLLMYNMTNFIFQSHILVSVNWKFCDSSLWLLYEQQWPHVAVASGIHVSGNTKGTHLSSWQEYKNMKCCPLWYYIYFSFCLKTMLTVNSPLPSPPLYAFIHDVVCEFNYVFLWDNIALKHIDSFPRFMSKIVISWGSF